jgi:phospholipase/carboxylesterase
LNVYVNDPQQSAEACVIWMHGLGADAQDMAGLATQLPISTAIRHVFLDAPVRPVTLNNRMPMRAWYDIVGLTLNDREDSEGIKQSEEFIRQVITSQEKDGFTSDQIFLAGFSQGGAMALFTGLHTRDSLGGIIALSAYLPLASKCKSILNPATPIFMAGGVYDPIVLPAWTKQSVEAIRAQGFQYLTYQEYPMEHTICLEEIQDLSQWLTKQIKVKGRRDGDNNDNG